MAPGTGTIYVADTDHNRILVYPPEGSPLYAPGALIARWGAQGGAGAAGAGQGEFDHPDAIAANSGGEIYVADTANDRIVHLSSAGAVLGEWGGPGTAPGRFQSPTGIAVDGAGDVYVVDSGNNRVEAFNPGGSFLFQWGERGVGPGEFSQPSAIAVDCRGNVYVADTNNNRVQRFDLAVSHPAPGGCLSAAAWPPPLDVPPVLHVGLIHAGGIIAAHGLALTVSCQRGCRVRLGGTVAPRGRHAAVKLLAVTRSLPAAVTGHVRLRLTAALANRLRRELRRKRGLKAHLTIVAVGPTGRRTTLTETYLLTR